LQQICAFYLATDYNGACGPRSFGDDNDKPELFIVRFQRNATYEALKAEKRNNLMDAIQGQHSSDASQLVARYKGSDEIQEVRILMISGALCVFLVANAIRSTWAVHSMQKVKCIANFVPLNSADKQVGLSNNQRWRYKRNSLLCKSYAGYMAKFYSIINLLLLSTISC
jgi:hypothetical protein